jgi:GNAT superfamily N-acetyltransferase
MEIVPFEPSMAEDMARRYNELIEPVPECYPVSADRFASVEALAHRRVRDEEIAVALAGGDVAGFVHVGVALPAKGDEEPKGDPAVIRFLSYRPGQRRVGQALFEWAEEWARERRRGAIVAFEAELRYPFYHFGYAHLSERIAHVHALLGMNGCKELGGEVYLTWNDYTPPEPVRPPLDVELKLEWREGTIGRRLSVCAMQDDKEVGRCDMDLGQHSRPSATDWCFCDELWVRDELQGKRVGMFLLCTALTEMRERGCTHAAISTGHNNHRAQLMYTNLGYCFTDNTMVFRKELQHAGPRSGG